MLKAPAQRNRGLTIAPKLYFLGNNNTPVGSLPLPLPYSQLLSTTLLLL
jgi:hypothetical protein